MSGNEVERPIRRPRLELFQEIALDRGIPVDEAALEEIRSVYERYRGGLETVRSWDLPIVPGGIEPMSALRWIEHQGRAR
jgi:hypothetical protein